MNTSLRTNVLLLDHWRQYPTLSQEVHDIVAVIMIVFFIVTVTGNVIVIILFAKYKSLRTAANIYVVNLSVADLSLALQCIPLIVYSSFHGDWTLGGTYCQYHAFISAFTGFVSILALTAMAVDRYVVISRPIPMMTKSDKFRAYWIIAIVWLLAGVGALLPILGFGSYVLDGSRTSCTFDQFTHTPSNIAYNLTIQLIFFFIPVTAIVSSYVLIYIKVRRNERVFFTMKEKFNELGLRRMRKSKSLEKNELRIARAVVVIVILFCFSWLPYCVISIISMYGDRSKITPFAVTFPGLLAKGGTLLNPFVYALLQRNFKMKFIAMIFSRTRHYSWNNRPSQDHTCVYPATVLQSVPKQLSDTTYNNQTSLSS